jgi:hypothetical protein
MLDVRTERCDRLAVDPSRARVRSDFRPSSCEVRGIGDGFQQLTQRSTLLLSAVPLASSASRAASLIIPLGGPRLIPNHCSPNDTRFAAWSRSGPFTGHRRLLNGGPLTHILAVSHRALPRLRHYYEPV